MSQAARNFRGYSKKLKKSHYNNNGQLAGFLFLFMVLSTIFLGSWRVLQWLKDANRLTLSHLVLTGARYYTTNDDICQAILLQGSSSTFMMQDVNVIQRQIKRLPWIKQANIRKIWPDELKIHLIEYVPIAWWNDLLMIDVEGNVFSIPSDRIDNRKMPLLYGPSGSEADVMNGYNTMSKMLENIKLTLKMVAMSARHSWQLRLENDIRLELGRYERLRRLERFIELYPLLQRQAQNDKKRVSYVDLRYNSGAAIGWVPSLLESTAQTRSEKRR